MRAIVTIIGEDRIGIIAKVSGVLAAADVNILDISQTVMRGCFTMIMLVDMALMSVAPEELSTRLEQAGKELGMSIRLQREEIFKRMHEV